MSDPWLGETTAYDPNKVYVAASDKRGHQSTIRVHVPAGMPGEIAAIIAQVPELRTVHDFYRDALVHAIARWRDKLPELEASDWGGKFLRVAALEDRHERMMVEKDLVAKFKSIFNDAYDMPMVRQEILMEMRGTLPTLESESLRRELEAILQANPIFTDDFRIS